MKMGFLYVLLYGCVGCAVVERAPRDPLDSPIFVRGGIYRALRARAHILPNPSQRARLCDLWKLAKTLFYLFRGFRGGRGPTIMGMR
jgi:hypothetical protein